MVPAHSCERPRITRARSSATSRSSQFLERRPAGTGRPTVALNPGMGSELPSILSYAETEPGYLTTAAQQRVEHEAFPEARGADEQQPVRRRCKPIESIGGSRHTPTPLLDAIEPREQRRDRCEPQSDLDG